MTMVFYDQLPMVSNIANLVARLAESLRLCLDQGFAEKKGNGNKK